MIKSGAAAYEVVVHSRCVGLEWSGVGLNGYWDGLLSDGCFEGENILGSNAGVGQHGQASGLGWIKLASLSKGGVGVDELSLHGVSLEVVEGKALIATIAAQVQVGAVNELLFGHVNVLFGFNPVSGLNATDGGESPAWTALTLVTDWLDSASGNPVDWSGGSVEEYGSGFGFKFTLEAWESLELMWGPVGEFIVARNEGVSWVGILGIDEFVNWFEVGESHVEFLNWKVGFVEVGDELHKFGRNLWGGGSADEGSDEGGSHVLSNLKINLIKKNSSSKI